MSQELLCALCFYTRDEPEPAVTVIDGYATCDDHAGYFQSAEINRMITIIEKERE